MNIVRGERPPSIWLFGVISLYLAIRHLVIGLGSLEYMEGVFERTAPWFPWNEDWTIVTLSAWFTIELIPVGLVFLFASRFARWFVFFTSFIPMVILFLDYEDATTYPSIFALGLFYAGVPIAIATLLFMPGANRWFETERLKKEDEIAVFD